MWRISVILVAVACGGAHSWMNEAECLTAAGSAGQCLPSSECPLSTYREKPVMCRYSRGRGIRICCPRSTSFSPFQHHFTDEREDHFNNDGPIAFPADYKPTNSRQPNYRPTTDSYDGRPFTYDSYRPFNPSTSFHNNRPVFNERPSYESGSDYSSLNHRPHYSEQSRPDFNERPESVNRPSYNNQPSYNERPTYIPDSNPSYSRPRPDFNERPESANWSSHNNRPSYSERPTFVPDSKPSFNRPDYNERPETLGPPNSRPSFNNERPSLVSGTSDTFGQPNYNERPGYGNPSLAGGNQGRPNVFRPEPVDVHGSSEGSAWDFPTTRRTTPRPNWAVEGGRETTSSNRGRISEQKCEEYGRAVTETIDVLPLSLDSEAVPHTVQKCDFSAVKLIVGGEASELGEFPHMAAVGYPVARSSDINWSCGGTLISEEYVLTAGHCVNTSFGNPAIVRLGEYNLARDNDGAEPEDYRVSRIIVHPKYSKNRKYDDIALLHLTRSVRFNKWIRPACLNSDNNIRGTPIATGWGRTDFVGKLSDILMKVSLNIIDNRQCNTFYTRGPGTASFSSGITDTMLCAGVLEGGRDSCLGDSGGPLTINKKDNPCIHFVIGVTSFGKVCGAPNSPGVYTRVSKYISWIERTVWPNF